METYIFVHKKAAPDGTQDDLHSAKAPPPRHYQYLSPPPAPRQLGRIFGGLMGALVAAAIWVPVAYLTRGYWAVGGEIFLIGLAAGLGAWLGGGEP